MKNLLKSVSKSIGIRSKQLKIDRIAEALIIDLKSGEFQVENPNNRYYPIFAGKNERLDHNGYVSWLNSKDFQDAMNAFHEASIMYGIESIG